MGSKASKHAKDKHSEEPVNNGEEPEKADDKGKQPELEAADDKGKQPGLEAAADKGKQPEMEAEDECKKPAGENDADGIEITETGRMIRPRGLSITWGNDTRYWRLQVEGKKEDQYAELLQVCWLQVTGSVDLEHGKSYKIKFKISLTTKASGWNGLPLFLMSKIGDKGKYTWKKIKPLDETKTDKPFEIPEEDFIVQIPKDGDKKLFFGFYEIWSNKWKTGLLIHNAIIEEVSSGN